MKYSSSGPDLEEIARNTSADNFLDYILCLCDRDRGGPLPEAAAQEIIAVFRDVRDGPDCLKRPFIKSFIKDLNKRLSAR
jgi:hypothetical protein